MAENTVSGAAAPETNVCGAPVPRVLHQIWLQGLPAGEPGALTNQAMAVAVASGWHYALWSHARMVAELSVYRLLQGQCRTFAHFANLGRFAILSAFGGLYLDADVELFTLPVDLRGAWVWTCDEGARIVNPCCLAAPPGHPYMRRALEECAQPGVWRMDIGTTGVRVAWLALREDVKRWPREAWRGGHGAFGEHRGRCDVWRSFDLYGS